MTLLWWRQHAELRSELSSLILRTKLFLGFVNRRGNVITRQMLHYVLACRMMPIMEHLGDALKFTLFITCQCLEKAIEALQGTP